RRSPRAAAGSRVAPLDRRELGRARARAVAGRGRADPRSPAGRSRARAPAPRPRRSAVGPRVRERDRHAPLRRDPPGRRGGVRRAAPARHHDHRRRRRSDALRRRADRLRRLRPHRSERRRDRRASRRSCAARPPAARLDRDHARAQARSPVPHRLRGRATAEQAARPPNGRARALDRLGLCRDRTDPRSTSRGRRDPQPLLLLHATDRPVRGARSQPEAEVSDAKILALPGRAPASIDPPTVSPGPAIVWLRRVALGLSAGWALILAVVFALRVGFPLELEWMEGGSLQQAFRVQQGLPVYGPPSPEFVPFLYPPLYPALLALLG